MVAGDVVRVKVRDAGNTYAARARGHVATCTAGREQALRALMLKLGASDYRYQMTANGWPSCHIVLVAVLAVEP